MQSKCKYCRTPFKFYSAKMPFCRGSDECINACFSWVTEKKSKQIKSQTQRRKKQETKEIKESLTNYKSLVQKNINEITRLIDFGLRGLHETKEDTGIIHAGHIHSVQRNEYIRFNLHNIHRQGAKSNTALTYDLQMMFALEEEYGKGYYNFVKSLQYSTPPKLMNFEYKEINSKCISIIKDLKKDLVIRSKQERIYLRNKINKELGIYEEKYLIYKYYKRIK